MKSKKGNYIVNSLNGMAYGFFCSLIIGTILKQIGGFTGIEQLVEWGTIATYLMGPAIGIGVGYTIQAKGINLIAAVIAGAIGAGTFAGGSITSGNPIAAYFAVLVAIEVTRLIQDKTPIDILLVPFTSIIVAGIFTMFATPYIVMVINWISQLINQGMQLQPILMSIVVAALMGMALTAPISSAAIGVMLNLNGLVAGAALVGCCCQMLGFAIMSAKDNQVGDVIAVGIGTSMLQFKNIVKKPTIWLPPILASVIVAPIATVLVGLECNAIGSGMGTAGFVGVLQAIEVMGTSSIVFVLLFTVFLPLLATYSIYMAFVKLNYIKSGDLKIERL